MSTNLRSLFKIVFFLVVSLSVISVQAVTIVDLGHHNYPTSINNKGQVVGSNHDFNQSFLYSNGLLQRDFIGRTNTGVADLITAYDINDAGQVVGAAYFWASRSYHAFLYSNGLLSDLGALPPLNNGTMSQALSINNNGQIVGDSFSFGGDTHAFLYSNGLMNDLGILPGRANSYATSVNDSGQIVGYSSYTNNITSHAFLYDGTMHDLGTLGGFTSFAWGINNVGQIIGDSHTSGGQNNAFLWQNGMMHDLGTLPGYSGSTVYGINNNGQIVGFSDNSNGNAAFLYNNGTMINLNSLLPPGSGWTLTETTAINDYGQIIGVGFNNLDSEWHGFVMTIPEPGTLILALIGAILVGFVHRFRKH